MGPTANVIINVNPPTPEARHLWAKALELAEVFGADGEWALVGGLMVQLHGFEQGSDSRPTTDIDLLGDSRSRPAMTKRLAEALVQRGGEMAMPSVTDEDLGYRFELDGEIVEVLGSEGARADPKTLGKHTTLQVAGGTQALRRAEAVLVSLNGAPPVQMRRPNLLGAILMKARVLAKRRPGKFESDRQDLVRLLSFVDDPRTVAEELKGSERKWLRDVERVLSFDEASLGDLFPADEIARARQTLQLLIA